MSGVTLVMWWARHDSCGGHDIGCVVGRGSCDGHDMGHVVGRRSRDGHDMGHVMG